MNEWKIKRDKIYYPLYLKYGLDYITNAGFFFDSNKINVELEDTLSLMCTPLHHIKTNNITDKSVILLTSGAMCPIHDGHIALMTSAKEQLEKNGYDVIGGYIAPDHDNYVHRKSGLKNTTAHRLELCSTKIFEHHLESWLSVDPWYSAFTQTDINFSDLLIRTELYIKKYLNINVKFCYVFGSDNARFYKTFIDSEYMCCIVDRHNTDNTPEDIKYPNVFHTNSKVILSSTILRMNGFKFRDTSNKTLKLRRDNSPDIPISIFSPYFHEIVENSLTQQIVELHEMGLSNVISLDPLIVGDYYVPTSRLYDYFGHTKVGCQVDLSGVEHLKYSVEKYNLYDDDIYTGETIRFVSKQLREYGIKINMYFSFEVTNPVEYEILDNRDFVIFGEYNGLKLFSGVRVPYVYPFVDPSLRCSISNPLQFSIDVWEFNYNLNKGTHIVLKNTPQCDFYTKIGFDENTTLDVICKHYLDILRGLYDGGH